MRRSRLGASARSWDVAYWRIDLPATRPQRPVFRAWCFTMPSQFVGFALVFLEGSAPAAVVVPVKSGLGRRHHVFSKEVDRQNHRFC